VLKSKTVSPVLVDDDAGWKGGPCRVCKRSATGRRWLYVTELPDDPEEVEQDRIVGEAYQHAGKDDCVYPPALAAALLSKV
jgi:hypothetical protein